MSCSGSSSRWSEAVPPGSHAMPGRVVAIVLAAGLSSRMGRLKQLLPLCGRPVVRVVVERVAPRVNEVVVVVGHRAEEVRRALFDSPARCVHNADFAMGMSTSVACGVLAAPDADAWLICLGDQPGVADGPIAAVLAAAAASGRGIVVPTWDGRWGHPILLRSRYREEVLALGGERGLNVVTRGHPDDTLAVPVADQAVVEDMDTPADYEREQHRQTAPEVR